MTSWFEVDKAGLAKLLEARGKWVAVTELIQNAWDSEAREVNVILTPVENSPRVVLEVRDDDPDGFRDLTHAFTLFAESYRKADPEKRGRFNLGEKLVLALCVEAEVISTTGSYRFDPASGRTRGRKRTKAGSVFTGILRMTREELAECTERVESLIPPRDVETYFNGEELPHREPLAEFETTLPTEIADDEGKLRRTQRKTTVRVYEPGPDETPSIYELGIPVVETGDRWHVDVQQKVPLNFNRDNVLPSFLRTLRTLVLNEMHNQITEEDATETWVREAAADERCSEEAVGTVVRQRFGDRAVAYDPSDQEANSRAAAAGYTVVSGGSMSSGEWENVRRAGSMEPAGRVTPTPQPYTEGGEPLKLIPADRWTDGMRYLVEYAKAIGRELTGREVEVRIANEPRWPFGATYSRERGLVLNRGRLGRRWFSQGITREVNATLVHEFAHHYAANHLSDAYHRACCDLAAHLVEIALDNPEVFGR